MSNFDSAIAGDARLTARWDATRDKILAEARAAGLGEIDPDSLKDLPGVKLAVFTDMGLPSDLLEEVKRLPAVAALVQKAEVARQLADSDSDLQRDIHKLNQWQRMALGREQIQARAAAEKAAGTTTLSPEDEQRAVNMIRAIQNPADRLAAARAVGLLP